ncbi:hypothetical protein EW145_g8104 [Phellinidium pouzarii]|uniref:Uncharacterized protein n=1 Tax=Phellinidium pouzarii TaxID=167371 RepID=A0A4S4K9M4_9AGAM|nr:hypothetical protein EW145_g8104 [Phellinidium pouzarii]
MDGVDSDVFVKFTSKYCEAAHKHLADHGHGLAPTLHACVRIRGGLLMVTMDFVVGEDGHDAGYVFGDLRLPNGHGCQGRPRRASGASLSRQKILDLATILKSARTFPGRLLSNNTPRAAVDAAAAAAIHAADTADTDADADADTDTQQTTIADNQRARKLRPPRRKPGQRLCTLSRTSLPPRARPPGPCRPSSSCVFFFLPVYALRARA